MRRYSLVFAFALAVALSAPAFAQDPAKQMDEKAMMEAYMKAATPGEQHKMLQASAGSWTTTIRIWGAPGQPPTETKGWAEVKPLLDGRYVQEEFHGEMMGMPFTGIGVNGYDNTQKKFVSTWVDSMSTTIMTMEGTYDAASKTYTYTGKYVDPLRGDATMRIVTRVVDADNHVSEFFEPAPDGKWNKMMEIAYKRK